MNRRHFLARAVALLAGSFLLPRRLRAQVRPDSGRAAPPALPLPEPSLWLAAAGDTTPGYNLEAHYDEQIAAGVPREELWPLYFAGVRPLLEAADVALVNLECPFTERGTKLVKNFNFRARPELIEILKAGSVDVVSLANNHLSDYGPEGVEDTMHTLDAAGIAHFGAGMSLAKARRPVILERNGLRIGLVGYYFQAEPDMLEPRTVYATSRRAGVAGVYKNLPRMRKQMEHDLKKLVPSVDVAIPFFHWGKEGSTEVRDYQIELAHRAVDLGCKAVLGAHPHRLQGVEIYRGAPIFYSLGNFVFGGNKDPKDKLSAIARLRLARSGVLESELVPIQITRWPEAPFQPFLLEGAQKDEALTRIAELSRGLAATLPQLAPYPIGPQGISAPLDPSLTPVDTLHAPR